MYVIIYGSVAVRKIDNSGKENTVLCLYDGHHFGEIGYGFVVKMNSDDCNARSKEDCNKGINRDLNNHISEEGDF